MFLSPKQAIRTVLGRNRGRAAKVFPDDAYIVSYPKSGNTWARFLVGNLLVPDLSVSFENIESIVPNIHANPDKVLKKVPRPRTLKSHESFHPGYRTVVYIVRDPRDVVLSFHRYKKKMRKLPMDHQIEDFVQSFIEGSVSPYGNWEQNVRSWLHPDQDGVRVHFVRYEDLLVEPEEQLAAVSKFLGLDCPPRLIADAVASSSFEKMRHMESTQNWDRMKGSREDIAFVRSGKSSGWESNLPSGCARKIESAWGTLMGELGYLD